MHSVIISNSLLLYNPLTKHLCEEQPESPKTTVTVPTEVVRKNVLVTDIGFNICLSSLSIKQHISVEISRNCELNYSVRTCTCLLKHRNDIRITWLRISCFYNQQHGRKEKKLPFNKDVFTVHMQLY